MTYKDPIIEEIHNVRADIARQCDYDLKKIGEYITQQEKQHSGAVFVTREQVLAQQQKELAVK